MDLKENLHDSLIDTSKEKEELLQLQKTIDSQKPDLKDAENGQGIEKDIYEISLLISEYFLSETLENKLVNLGKTKEEIETFNSEISNLFTNGLSVNVTTQKQLDDMIGRSKDGKKYRVSGFYSCDLKTIFLTKKSSQSTIIHEMFHWLYDNNSTIKEVVDTSLSGVDFTNSFYSNNKELSHLKNIKSDIQNLINDISSTLGWGNEITFSKSDLDSYMSSYLSEYYDPKKGQFKMKKSDLETVIKIIKTISPTDSHSKCSLYILNSINEVMKSDFSFIDKVDGIFQDSNEIGARFFELRLALYEYYKKNNIKKNFSDNVDYEDLKKVRESIDWLDRTTIDIFDAVSTESDLQNVHTILNTSIVMNDVGKNTITFTVTG